MRLFPVSLSEFILVNKDFTNSPNFTYVNQPTIIVSVILFTSRQTAQTNGGQNCTCCQR